jgi:hypothetical protein
MRDEMSNKTTDLFSILHENIDYSRLTNSLTEGFQNHFNVEIKIAIPEETVS